jgi:hypothetical protein
MAVRTRRPCTGSPRNRCAAPLGVCQRAPRYPPRPPSLPFWSQRRLRRFNKPMATRRRATRSISRTAARSSSMKHRAVIDTTRSKLPAACGSARASATSWETLAVSRRRAYSTHSGLISTPVTGPPIAEASARVKKPVPQPTSSSDSPGRGCRASRSNATSRCPIHRPRGVSYHRS